jgi:drug/metabolite transporter (DMT)-like permease
VARKLSAVSSGLSIMLVPVFGVTGGALILGEAVTLPDIIALVLILLSMLVVLFPDTKLKALISSKSLKS